MDDILYFKYTPVTSVNIERSFSVYKYLLSYYDVYSCFKKYEILYKCKVQ